MAGGYLSGAMRRNPREIDTGDYVGNVSEAMDEMPSRVRGLSDRVYGPGVQAISRSREMRGADDRPADYEGRGLSVGGLSGRLDAIYQGMVDKARRSGEVDISDTEAVLRWAEDNDPTDSTMEAAQMIREQMRRPSGGLGQGEPAPAYPQRR